MLKTFFAVAIVTLMPASAQAEPKCTTDLVLKHEKAFMEFHEKYTGCLRAKADAQGAAAARLYKILSVLKTGKLEQDKAFAEAQKAYDGSVAATGAYTRCIEDVERILKEKLTPLERQNPACFKSEN